jgi:Mn-containing catalase
MFHHIKELQFNARVTKPDPKFATLLLEQFGGPNGELKAALQYFVQAFSCRQPYPAKYDMLMDIATEEFSHLEIVGATITMLLNGVNGKLKDAAERSAVVQLVKDASMKEQMLHEVASINPIFAIESGGGPVVTDAQGNPFSGTYINANGDLTVDLRSNIAAESRAKIVYEYLLQFTDDPHVKDSLRFLMTREISHFQMFSAALADITPNFPPGILQGDPRFTHTYFNMSNGADARGPWNEGRGPWNKGEEWVYVDRPAETVDQTRGLIDQPIQGTSRTQEEVDQMDKKLSKKRSSEISSKVPNGENQWTAYQPEQLESPQGAQT